MESDQHKCKHSYNYEVDCVEKQNPKIIINYLATIATVDCCVDLIVVYESHKISC